MKRHSRIPRIAGYTLLAAGAYAGVCTGLAWNFVRPKPERITATPAELGIAYQRFATNSGDGTRLAGWLLPSQGHSRGTIILCHGVDSTRLAMLPKAEFLHRHGFTTILFDFRARGESGGARCTLGYREVDDLLAVVRYVQSCADLRDNPIGVLGESMGGAVALMGAARNPAIRAVVAESPFARLDRAISNHFRAYLGPLAPLMASPVRAIGARIAGSDIAAVTPIDEVGRISPRPLLLIQDGDDRLCPPAETLLLYNAAGAPKQRWIVPGSGHVGAQATAPAEYERRVTQFFDEALR